MIIALDDAKRRLLDMEEIVQELGNQLRIEEAKERAAELERETMVETFWNDAEKSSKKLQEIKQLKDKVESYEELIQRLEDTLTLCEMAIEENDESSVDEVLAETEFIETEAEKKRIEVLLCGPYDKNNAIVSFHPGAGGTEAQDWASMLYRMYVRWGEKSGFNVKLVDWLDGDEAGLKSATIMVEGINAYGYLKSENGVHRLVRVSPFDSSGRRHTSFASVEVMPEFNDDDNIVIRIRDYGPGIPEDEIPLVKKKFYKGSSKARGSGIGLAVCDEIVEMHGGQLILENAPGGGSSPGAEDR